MGDYGSYQLEWIPIRETETSSREQRLPRDAGEWARAHPALAPMQRRSQYEYEYEAGG